MLSQKKGENMKISAKISIEGIKPLLFNTFPISALSEKKPKEGTTGNNKESWKETVLMDTERRLFVYETYVIKSTIEGGKEIKVGKGNLSKKVTSTLEVDGASNGKIYLDELIVPSDEELTSLDHMPVYLDIRAVVNPMTKGRNLRYRIAARTGWKCTFYIKWDDCLVSKDQMRLCVENGGVYQGIGDGRKIGFGRFKVLAFEMVK
jgi:hypothetical protein